jgi:ABC-type branched-subunit amino acid transport system ATPase component
MPHISHLTIKNFRKFEHLDIDFTDPAGEPVKYFVLAGPNGCGKTTVLEAIAFTTGLNGKPDDKVARLTNPELVSFGLAAGAELLARFRPNPASTEIRVALSRESLCIEHWNESGDRTSRGWDWWDLLGKPHELARFTNALRSEHQVPQSMSKSSHPAPSLGSGLDSRISRFNVALKNQLTRRVPGYRGPEPKDVEWTERLNTFWRKFRNDGTDLVMTLVNPDDLDQNDWDLFLYEGEKRICSVGELSSGEQEIIAMAVPFITEPFDGVLLIDEPELHLHPEWQARLMRALRALIPDAQIIVATHSDELWDDAKSWERLLLVPDGDPRASRGSLLEDSAE